jgi:PAS domain S-box-containing protein
VDLVQQLTAYTRNRLFMRYTALFFALMLVMQAGAGWVFSKWFAGRLDDQRRVDTNRALSNFIQQRWSYHGGAVTGYAWWSEPWAMARRGDWAGARVLFAPDPTLESFDLVAAISADGKTQFQLSGAPEGSAGFEPSPELVEFLLHHRSMKRGESHLIVPHKGEAYMVTAAALSESNGTPALPGILVFAYNMDRVMRSAEEILPVKLSLSAMPRAEFFSYSLAASMRREDPPLYLHIEPVQDMEVLLRSVILGFLGVQVACSFFVFWGLAPRFARRRNAELEGMVKSAGELNAELNRRLNELQAARGELEKSERKYRDLVESSAAMIFSLDSEGKILTVNQAASSLLAYQPASLIGKNFLSLIHEPPDVSIRFRKQLIFDKLEEVRQTRNPVQLSIDFSTRHGEPRELDLRIEYVATEDGYVFFGKASSQAEDSLLRFCERENMKYVIGNYLTLSEEISHRITHNLTRYCDTSTAVSIRICVSEMIINAIEHGNLAITYDEKTKATDAGQYLEFLRARQADPAYASRRVTIYYSLNPKKAAFLIVDEGEGFDSRKVLEDNAREANRQFHLHGRGITMAKHAFDILRYNARGNRVLMIKRFESRAGQSGESAGSASFAAKDTK